MRIFAAVIMIACKICDDYSHHKKNKFAELQYLHYGQIREHSKGCRVRSLCYLMLYNLLLVNKKAGLARGRLENEAVVDGESVTA